jgi:pseudaminic acid cytidylyltransferase
MSIAIIPARGGSKRIPRKNIKEFNGKPMIAWSIEAAIKCELFDQVIVSTDDIEIADIAKSYGASVPFMRPAHLANDTAATLPVIAHATQWAIDNHLQPQAVCCIYATAPFINVADLKLGQQKITQESWDYAFPVTTFPAPIYRSFRADESQGLEMFYPENFNMRSQDLPEAYHDAGQFYWGKSRAWLAQETLFAKKSFPIKIPRWRVQDIDTPEDWIRAEIMFKNLVSDQ